MLAIDTNVLVRFLTRDDPAQAERARSIIETETIFIPTTVWLETEWVLRNVFGYTADRVLDRFAAIAGMPGVRLEEPAKLAAALAWTRAGLDFADALHLAAADSCEAMVTFDHAFRRRASDLAATPVKEP